MTVPVPMRAPVPSAAPGSALARWISYFDAVEQSVIDLAERISNGHQPVWPDLAVPAGALPRSLVARRDEVVALIGEVTERAERRRDTIAAELAALAPARPAPATTAATSLGHRLDVVG